MEDEQRKYTKELIQNEILALLNDNVESELDAMDDCYTIAEIARESLLSFDRSKL